MAAEQQPGRLVSVPQGGPASAQQRRSPETETEGEVEAEVGQIWLVRTDSGPSLTALIIEVHDVYVRGLLCGEEWDLATETDAVLQPRQSGAPRRLLVHGDVSAAILKPRLAQWVGAVDPELADRIAMRGRGRDFDSRDLGRGSAIIDDNDPRWEWKLEQHKRMRAVRARASELGWSLHRLGQGDRDPGA